MTEINDHKTFWKRSTMEIITYTEGSLADIIQLARKDILSLITTIESQKEEIEKLKVAISKERLQIIIQKRTDEISPHRTELGGYHTGLNHAYRNILDDIHIEQPSNTRELDRYKAITELAVKENERLRADLEDIGSGWYGEKSGRRAKLSLSKIQEGMSK